MISVGLMPMGEGEIHINIWLKMSSKFDSHTIKCLGNPTWMVKVPGT